MVIDQINRGKLYIGESTGSIIVSADIAYASIMDDASIVDASSTFERLNLIDLYPVPHYKDEPFVAETDAIIEQLGSTLNLMPIPNNQAIVLKCDAFEVLTNES